MVNNFTNVYKVKTYISSQIIGHKNTTFAEETLGPDMENAEKYSGVETDIHIIEPWSRKCPPFRSIWVHLRFLLLHRYFSL
jgi:hypothetical protein